MSIVTWEFESPPLHSAQRKLTEKKISTNAEIAQLVEHNLAKVGVASSSLVFRSPKSRANRGFALLFPFYGARMVEW